MNRCRNIFTVAFTITMVVALGFTQSQAATINVPGDQPTIAAAVAAAAAGDTILVSDGTYASVFVNKANLTILSVNGAGTTIIQENIMDTPVVDIAAPGVTIGGAAGQGFTINQLYQNGGNDLGNCAIRVRGDVVGSGSVTIRSNTLTGYENPEGILYSYDGAVPTYASGSGATVNITNNFFTSNSGGMYGFNAGIKFYDYMHPAPLSTDISAFDMTIDISHNTMVEIDANAVDFSDDVYKSNVNISFNEFTDTNQNNDCFEFNSDVTSFSNVTISDNRTHGFDWVVYVSGNLENGSSMTVSGNNFQNFYSYGAQVDCYYGSTCSITGNTMHGDEADYGLDIDTEYGSTSVIDGNTITNVDRYGMYVSETYAGSSLTVTNNTVLMIDTGGSSYGLYTDTDYGSETTIRGNTIRGFNYAGIYESYPEDGSTFTLENNTFDANDSAGADYGIWVDECAYGSTAVVNNNIVKDITYAGFYFGSDSYYGSSLSVTNNTFTGYTSDRMDYGIYFSSDVYEHSTAVVTGNTCTQWDYAGFYCDDVYDYSSIMINNNTFTGVDGSYGIYLYDPYYYATATINGNTISGADYGIEQDYTDDFATTEISGNTINANYPNASYGIYTYETYDGSALVVTNNSISGFEDGFYNYDIYDGSTLLFDGNTVNGFWDAGAYCEYNEYGSFSTFSNNHFTADENGAYYGIWTYDNEYGATLVFVNNTVSGIGNQGGSEAGFYNDDYIGYEGCNFVVTGNSFTAHSNGSEYGFYSDNGADYGNNVIISNNMFSGFTGEGLYTYYCEDGTNVTIANNTFTSHELGCDYGLDFDDGVDYGSNLTVTGNTVTGPRMYLVYIDDINDGSTATFTGNTFTGNTNGCQYGFWNNSAIDYGSIVTISNNTFTNIADPDGTGNDDPYDDDGVGLWLSDSGEVSDGSQLTICGNTITGIGTGDNTGIVIYYVAGYGSPINICENNISGFALAPLWFDDDIHDGSIVTVESNVFTGGQFSVYYDGYTLEDGGVFTINNNAFNDFSVTGMNLDLYFGNGGVLNITNNRFKTASADFGIDLQETIEDSSEAHVNHNCFIGPATAIQLIDITDSSFLDASANDFAGVTTGIINNAGDADHTVNAENSFWTGAPVNTGQVDADPVAAAHTDADGDGVADCDDTCPDTTAGAAVDANGCSCLQNNPTGDADGDGILDCNDNCPNNANPDQADSDGDGVGDACEAGGGGGGGGAPCGLCGAGAGIMVPFAVLSLVFLGRRSNVRRRKDWKMNSSTRFYSCLLAALCALGLAGGQAFGATINVPADFMTLQAAIDAATAGDTILVAQNETVTTTVHINKANLTILSVGGAGSAEIKYMMNTDNTPVLTIEAAGITIGGAAGQGFTITQADVGADTVNGNSCIKIDGNQTGHSTITIQNCILQGDQADQGILVNPDMIPTGDGGATLKVLNNTFQRSGAAFGFRDAIRFYYGSSFSADDAIITITGNTMTFVENCGVLFDEDTLQSTVTISNNNMTSTANGYVGIYEANYFNYLSTATISGNVINDFDYPIYYYTESLSTVTVSGNTVTNFEYQGIYGYCDYGATQTISGNTCTGSATGDTGIETDTEYGASTTVSGNTINSVRDYGIYESYPYSGSTYTCTNNTVTMIANAGSGYGVYTDTEYGSHTTITGNSFTNFDYCGAYENYPDEGSTYVLENNTFDALDSSGADYGIYVDEPEYGCTALVNNNQVKDFNYSGFYMGSSCYYNSHLTITDNTFTGWSTTAPDYGIYFSGDVYDNSSATITGNTVTGFDQYGIYVDDVYEISSLALNNNTVTGVTAGSTYGIYVYDLYYNATGTVQNNTVTNFDTGFENDYLDDGAVFDVSGNIFNANIASSSYGIYFYEIYDGVLCTVRNNTVTSKGDGIILDDYMEYGSTLVIDGNTVNGWDDAGIYLYYMYDGSLCTVSNNHCTADTAGAYYGFYNYDVDDGAELNVLNNTFTGFGNQGGGEGGFYNDDEFYDGVNFNLTGNIFTAHSAGADYGFYSDSGFDYGAWGTIANNTFTGFVVDGLFNYYCEDGSRLAITNNTFTAHSSGCDDGMYFDDGVDYGSQLTVTGNTVTGPKSYLCYIYDIDDGSDVSISGNTFTGNTAGCEYGYYNDDNVDYGSTCTITNNSFTNIMGPAASDGYGMYPLNGDYVNDGSHMTICGNTITCLADGDSDTYGIYLNYVCAYGSTMNICDNTITGQNYVGIYFNDDIYTGSQLDVDGNVISGDADYGCYWDASYDIEDGSIVNITNNRISGFTMDGFYMGGETYGALVAINNNRFSGTLAVNGVNFDDTISSAAEVTVNDNCFQGTINGIRLIDILDTSTLVAHGNDFSGITTGVNNTAGDAAHIVNAENNFYAAAPVNAGQVDADPALAAAPDADGDGVDNCSDNCPGTDAGASVDANGCACLQLNPTGDADGDGILDCNDNCPNNANPDQADSDGDGTGDACEAGGGGGGAVPCGLCGAGGGIMVPMAVLCLTLCGRVSRRRRR